MTTALNLRYKLFRAPTDITDPGAGGSITISMDGGVCGVTTPAGAAARTLVTPTKEGIIGTVVLDVDGGGDLTLTVTGGYNADSDTTIVFGDAGDFVTFLSIKVGASYFWRVLAHEGTNLAMETLEVDTLTATTVSKPTVLAAQHGAGAIGTAFAPRTYRYTRDGTIITEIEIDLTGLGASGTENDVIGVEALAPAAYLGRNVTAANGIIYKVEMTCLEVPLTGDADVILVAGSEADEAFDLTVANLIAICDGVGDWALGKTVVNIAPGITADYYYYLVQGAADNADYTAGQFLIRFYGHAALA